VPEIADLPELIHAKYLSTTNRWTDLSARAAVTMMRAPERERAGSPLWRLVQSRYAISDIASVVLRDRAGCWGFIDLWRRDGVFEPSEIDLLSALATLVTPGLRGALLSTFTIARTDPADGPAVMLLDDDLRPIAQTEPTSQYLQALLPADPGQAAVPAAALNVAAQLCAVETAVDDQPPEARIFVPGRSWMTVRAGRIGSPDSSVATIAVTIEPLRATERASLYSRIAGLTERETAVLNAIVTGNDTRHVAQQLNITEHTVQDHLKSIFAKTSTDSRRQLISRATGTAQ
jgi:DNA-binding CsgD family transcriptional regulator